jgi:hypothetical protein
LFSIENPATPAVFQRSLSGKEVPEGTHRAGAGDTVISNARFDRTPAQNVKTS